MSDPLSRILQISASDIGGGGAEKIGWQLFQSYRERGLQSWLAVGRKNSEDPDVWALPHDSYRNILTRLFLRVAKRLTQKQGSSNSELLLRRVAELAGDPWRLIGFMRGQEDFNFPGTWDILSLPP